MKLRRFPRAACGISYHRLPRIFFRAECLIAVPTPPF